MNYNNLIDFSERVNYLNGSEVACVVKKYFNYDFATYQECDFLHSLQYWTDEQKKFYNEKKSNLNKKKFELGKDFENQIAAELREEYFNEIDDFSIAEKSLVNKEYRISATPDFLIRKNDGEKILIETKCNGSNTDKLIQYKYQVACQLLVIPDFDVKDEQLSCWIYFGIDRKKYFETNGTNKGFKPYILDKNELLKMQKEIIIASKKFWEDNEKRNFNFISFESRMQYLDELEKKTIVVDDELIIKAYELKQQLNLIEEKYELIKNEIIDNYNNVNCIQNDEIQITIKSGSKKVIDRNYRLNEIRKKEKEIEELKNTLDNETEVKEGKKSLLFKIL